MENSTFSAEQIAAAFEARNAAVQAIEARGIEFMQGGTTLPVGEHVCIIGTDVRTPDFERTVAGITKTYSIILQSATKDGEDASFVIPKAHLTKYIPGTSIKLQVYDHAKSGNKRVKVLEYVGAAGAINIASDKTNANSELELEYDKLDKSLSSLSGIPLAQAKKRMNEILELM